MNEHFPDWYREANLNPTQELLKQRVKGINKVVSTTKTDQVLELVRLLFSLPLLGESFHKTFCHAFRSADPTFPLRNNERELSVLAGAAIAEIIQKSNETANVAALATICASFLPYRSEPPIEDILSTAEEYLSVKSAEIRRDIGLPFSKVQDLKVKDVLNKLKTNFDANNDLPPAQLTGPLIDALFQITDAVERVIKSAHETTNSMSKTLELFSEETNILWWVFSEFSHELDKRMVDVDFSAACLIAGKELADLVQRVPGPVAANAFLDKMILSGRSDIPETIQLKDAINKSPTRWRENWVKKDAINLAQSICPIHYAAKTSLLTDGPNKWWPAYKKVTKIAVSHKIKPLDLALQVYRENLLLNELES